MKFKHKITIIYINIGIVPNNRFLLIKYRMVLVNFNYTVNIFCIATINNSIYTRIHKAKR